MRKGNFEDGFVTGMYVQAFNHNLTGKGPDDGLRGDAEFLEWDGDPNNGMAISTVSPLDFIGGGIASGAAWLGSGIGRIFGGGSARVTFSQAQGHAGHGARHLAGSGLSQRTTENAIRGHVTSNPARVTGPVGGQLQVGGHTVQYRAFPLPNNTVNVGTYYIP